MQWISRILAILYLALPLLAAGWTAWQSRKSWPGKSSIAFMLTCFSGSAIGTLFALIYAHAINATAPLAQVALCAYVSIGVLCLLKGLSWLLKEGIERVLVLRVPVAQRGAWWVTRATAALTVRVLLLSVLGLPYVMAVAMVYRPKVLSNANPRQQYGFAFEPVKFHSTDDIPLDAWWIPAAAPPKDQHLIDPDWGRRTIVLCHGLGANKDNQLALVRDLVPDGYNVLSFDFRAHGVSGGQITSFGDLERRDVLGAVQWVRQMHPEQSHKIFGVGISMGGAALIAAAADPSRAGRAFDAIAVYDTFDDLPTLVQTVMGRYFGPQFGWLARYIGLPIASAHAGVDLSEFSPGNMVDAIAPRPLLVIHGRGDQIIGFDQGIQLFERASEPKLRLWLGKSDQHGRFVDRDGSPADHAGVIYSEDAAKTVRMFFEEVKPML